MEGVEVLTVTFRDDGAEITCAFAADERRDLGRAHTFFVGYEHEEFGQMVRDMREAAEEAAWEIEHNYRRQPQ